MTEAKKASEPKTMADGPEEQYPVVFTNGKRTFQANDPADVIRLDSVEEWERVDKKK